MVPHRSRQSLQERRPDVRALERAPPDRGRIAQQGVDRPGIEALDRLEDALRSGEVDEPVVGEGDPHGNLGMRNCGAAGV